MKISFALVDVFAERPLTGNPLAVIPDAARLDEEAMRHIAAELNQAETTFLLPARDASADCRLRSFTASGQEVFGAGHNSLGAWWWLAESGALQLHEGQNLFTQEIGERLLPVEIECAGGRVVSVGLTQVLPTFGNVFEDVGALAAALRLAKEDFMPERFPCQVVSTGAAHLMVAIRNREAVKRARPDAAQLAKILQAAGGQGCYLFCLEPVLPTSMAHARFFNPTVGIVEDSATGSAAGPLACLLVARGAAKDGATVTIEQGYSMGRASLLHIYVNDGLVRLTGHCITVGEGNLRVR